MAQISHLVRIKAEKDLVYEQIASTKGIANWFTTAHSADYKLDGEITLVFPDGSVEFKVTKLVPGFEIVWHCTTKDNAWYKTDVKFRLKSDGNRTTVLFDHLGWPEITELFRDCSMSWAYFLESLKSFIEEGKGTPENMAPPCESTTT